MTNRCGWANSPLEIQYHDEEWGVPKYDDWCLFEYLVLEGAQAGLSWVTILKKRGGYRDVFAGFDPVEVANFDKRTVDGILQNDGIVRNRLKIESTVNNARMLLKVQGEFGSFSKYVWQFVGGMPIQNSFRTLSELPAKTPESILMSKDLTRRGFKFVGPTICYAFMQAVGMANDHLVDCFRYNQV